MIEKSYEGKRCEYGSKEGYKKQLYPPNCTAMDMKVIYESYDMNVTENEVNCGVVKWVKLGSLGWSGHLVRIRMTF